MDVKFLFIIPTLNSSVNLKNLLNSLRCQTYKNWRILFVDGNSKTKHQKWLEKACSKDNRLSWVKQEGRKGIYPAMNYGFKEVKNNEWLLFWGSDDYATNKNMLERLKNKIIKLNKNEKKIDIIFAKASYINDKKRIVRSSKFNFIFNYKFSLFLGNCPPHQATLLGPRAIKLVNNFSNNYFLASDLDYFCRLSLHKSLNFYFYDSDIVYMGIGGISQRKNKERFIEVLNIYRKYFGFLFLMPYILRYLLRFYSLIINFRLW